jgi:hypothetical protein
MCSASLSSLAVKRCLLPTGIESLPRIESSTAFPLSILVFLETFDLPELPHFNSESFCCRQDPSSSRLRMALVRHDLVESCHRISDMSSIIDWKLPIDRTSELRVFQTLSSLRRQFCHGSWFPPKLGGFLFIRSCNDTCAGTHRNELRIQRAAFIQKMGQSYPRKK